MPTVIDEAFMSEAEAAKALGQKVRTLRNWSATRQGPPRIKVGRKVLYRREALVAWLESREHENGGEAPAGKRSKQAAKR